VLQKLIQYTLKLHLLIRRSPSALAALLRTHILGTLPGLRPIMKKPYGTGLDARLKKTASGLSLARYVCHPPPSTFPLKIPTATTAKLTPHFVSG
jgi:hypothetical protein